MAKKKGKAKKRTTTKKYVNQVVPGTWYVLLHYYLLWCCLFARSYAIVLSVCHIPCGGVRKFFLILSVFRFVFVLFLVSFFSLFYSIPGTYLVPVVSSTYDEHALHCRICIVYSSYCLTPLEP